MKRVHSIAMFSFACLLYSINSSAEDLSKLSLIQNPGRNVPILRIDGEHYWINPASIDLPAGDHVFETFPPSVIHCSTKPGYIYKLNSYGCNVISRRMDFEGAKEYWEHVDVEEQREQAEKRATLEKERIQQAEQQYLTAAAFLKNANTKADLENVIHSFEHSIMNGAVDTDNLLENARQKLAPILEAEAKAEKEEQERQTKLKNERKSKERFKLAAFRKSIAEGVETNCGPVIEVKATLVKVYSPIANYGNEHWISRSAIFPSGYSCRFYNGEYQSPAED